ANSGAFLCLSVYWRHRTRRQGPRWSAGHDAPPARVRHGKVPAVGSSPRLVSTQLGTRHSRNETLWNISPGSSGSLRLDAGGLDHLAPLVDFVGDQRSKVGGRARKRRAAQVEQPGPQLGIGEARIDLLVELVSNLDRRGLRRADAVPEARLVARQEF